jgi:2-methylcitrate dehydratase PrpD
MADEFSGLKETGDLVQFLHECGIQDLPETVQTKTKLCILDAIGAGIAGPSVMEPVRIAYDLAKSLGKGKVTLLGDGSRVQVFAGAMANAISAMALDLGDVHRNAFFHASAGIIPAILATAEDKSKVSGRDLVLATALGIETGIRVALSVNPELRLKGLDTTSQCGIFGAAAGSMKILGGGKKEFLHALSLAGTQASGDIQYILDGDWSKCLHPGKASSDGVLAAYLAQRGYIGPHNILEGRYGFPLSSAGAFHRQQINKGLGQKWRILEMGMKIHAACRFSNAGIDAALQILSQHEVSAQDIKTVRVRMGRLGVDQLGNRDIKSFYDGQMSAPFLISLALLRGRVNFKDVLEGLTNNALKEMMNKLEMVADPQIGETARDTVVEVATNTGKVFTQNIPIPRGEPEIPLEQSELEGKFLDLAEVCMPAARARTLMEKILTLESLSRVEELWV